MTRGRYRTKKRDEHEYQQINEWLEEFAKSKDKERKKKIKAMIVTKMLPIVRHIARAIARRAYDPIEDMVQAGSIGVLKAVEKFSFNLGVEFRIYAGHLIIGEMRHYLRDKLHSIRVPAHIQELIFRITTFTNTLTQEQLNDLTCYEIASAINIPTQKVDFALMAERRRKVISIEDYIPEKTTGYLNFEQVMPYDNYKEMEEIQEIRLILDGVIKYLPGDCRKIIELYYYRDMAQNDIADVLGLTQMTVSRRLKKAFNLLYDMIADSEMHRPDDVDEEV